VLRPGLRYGRNERTDRVLVFDCLFPREKSNTTKKKKPPSSTKPKDLCRHLTRNALVGKKTGHQNPPPHQKKKLSHAQFFRKKSPSFHLVC
jgi:hypothetical protein